MAKRDSSEANTVAWVDLSTPDLDQARKFYSEVLGWSYVGGDDPNMGFYTTAQVGGRSVAGLAKAMKESPFPTAWSVYLSTTDADATTRKVTDAGGAVVVAPMDIPGQGRMAFYTDPTGAAFGVWQSAQHKGAQLVDEPGAMAWHEVYTRDVGKAREFYGRVFGLESKRMDDPKMEYWTLQKGPNAVCGVMQMGKDFPKDVPSHWNTYFAVADVDAATEKCVALGGKKIDGPWDTPFGRIAFVVDPFGAAFNLVKLPPASK
jgi:uncharacterized protein